MIRVVALIVGVFLIVAGAGAWLLLDAICDVDSSPTARVLRGDLDPEQLHGFPFTPWCEPSATIRPFVSWMQSFEKGKILRYRQGSRTDHFVIRQTYYEAEYLMPDGNTVIGPALGPIRYTAPNSRVLLAVIAIGVVLFVLGVARRMLWYVLDVVVIAILFACITFVHSSYLIWYVGGLHNRAPFMFDPYIWYLALATALAGICVVILLVRLAVTWPARIHGRTRLWGVGLSVVLSLVAYAGLHFVRLPGEYNEPFLLGYRKYARTHIDVPAIRAWVDTQDPNAYRGARIDLHALRDERKASLPQAITSLKPHGVEFFRDAHNHWAIRLDWGHVNEDWGVEIGRPDMEIPQTTLAKEEERYREFSIPTRRLPLPPGAYVWLRSH